LDETKVRISSAKVGGNEYVRCRPSERLDNGNVITTTKFGGEGINFFGNFSAKGVGILEKIDGNLTGAKYAAIIQDNVVNSIKLMNFNE